MLRTRKTKIAMMAAASVLASAAALGSAQAGDIDPAAYPAVVEIQTPGVAPDADHSDDQKFMIAGKWTLLAAAAAALAGIVKLVGARKIVRIAGRTAAGAAKVSVQAAAGAARVVGRVAGSPLRFAAFAAGLALFALFGVWLYDIEWIGGMVAGGAVVSAAIYGATKMRAFFRRANPLES